MFGVRHHFQFFANPKRYLFRRFAAASRSAPAIRTSARPLISSGRRIELLGVEVRRRSPRMDTETDGENGSKVDVPLHVCTLLAASESWQLAGRPVPCSSSATRCREKVKDAGGLGRDLRHSLQRIWWVELCGFEAVVNPAPAESVGEPNTGWCCLCSLLYFWFGWICSSQNRVD